MTTTREAALEAALQAISDLSGKSGKEFKRLHPALNGMLDKRPQEHWYDVLSEFADAALSTPATEPGYAEALAAIAALPYNGNEAGHEDAYRAVEALAARPAPQPAADTRAVPNPEALSKNNITIITEAPAPSDKIADAARVTEVAAVLDAVLPFAIMAGAMFRRNWNRDDVAIALDEPNDQCILTFDDFLDLHAAVRPFAALRALAGQGETP